MQRLLRQFRADLTYQLSTLPASVLAFSTVVAVLSPAATAIGLIIGLLLLLAIFAIVRWNARLERKRAAWAIGEPVGEAYRRREGNWLRRLRVVASDPQSWKDLAWLTVAGALGFVASVVTITAWGTIAGLIVLPAWYWSLRDDGVDYGVLRADTLGQAFLSGTDLGLIAVPVAYALDPEAVAQLLVPAGPDDPLASLTPREMDMMQLMAEGRTNHPIANGLHISESAVEKHGSTIFGKLDLPRSEDDHRRVMAVAAYLRR